MKLLSSFCHRFSFFFIALCCVCFSTVVFSKTLPLELFASLPSVQNVRLSPNGEKILFLVRLDSETKKGTAVSVYDVETEKKTYLMYSENDKIRIKWAKWGNNDKVLISGIYPAVRYGTPTTETRLLIVDVHTRKSRNAIPKNVMKRFDYVPQFQDQIVDMLPGDSDSFLIEMNGFRDRGKAVYKVSLSKRKMRVVQTARDRIDSWTTDRQHVVRIGVYWKDTTYKITHRFPGEKKWQVFWEFESFADNQVWPIGFAENPDILYVRALHNGFKAIFKVNLRDKHLTKELVYSKNYDVGGGLIYSGFAKKVIGISSSEDGGYTFFDETYEALQRGIDKVLPDTYNYFYSMSADERRYIVRSVSDKDPGVYLLGDRDKKSLLPVAVRYAGLHPEDLVDKKYVSYKARDGLEITAYLSLPNEWKSGERLPAVIFPHGGPISHDGKDFEYWTQFFANRGYAVLQMNFRGSSGYGHDFMKAGLKNWGLAMQDDIEDGARWLISEGYAVSKNICIVGASYGGYAALMGAVKTPDLYKCAISFAGVSDVAYLVSKSRAYTNNKIVKMQIGSDMKSLRERSPVNHADKISIPILLIHGTKDRSVRVAHSRKMHKRLKKAGKDVQYIELDNGSHFLSKNEHRLETFRAMEAFLAKHLKSAAAD